MKNRVLIGFAVAVVLVSFSPISARERSSPRITGKDDPYLIQDGLMTFHFDLERMEAFGLRFVPQGQLESDAFNRTVQFELDLSDSPAIEFSDQGIGQWSGGRLGSCGALLLDRPGERVVVGNLVLSVDPSGPLSLRSTLGEPLETDEPFDLGETWIDSDLRRREWRMESELLLDPEWSVRLEIPDAAGVAIGSVTIEALLAPPVGREVAPPEGGCAAQSAARSEPDATATVGSDILVANLQEVIRYAPVAGIHAFAVGTTACNIGNRRASWVASTNQHPVIVQNAYRLHEDRLEQIGMSWVKHGFYAISDNYCQVCTDPTNGTELGVGCSDPYSANLNGIQTNMSPRSTVNAHTGYFPYPWFGPPAGSSIERRVQVRTADLDPSLQPGARYFVEGHYVHPDDSAAGTQDNNASYREVRVVPVSGGFTMAVDAAWTTHRGQAAIRAWRDIDPTVTETDIRVPGEGLFILAAKVTSLGNGYWRYTYALQNLNSDRSARSFSLTLPPGAIVENARFHDSFYHSGEPYSNTAWTFSVAAARLEWSTVTFQENPDAQALRFDTTATFAFDCNVEPETAKVELGLFKPGLPEAITANTVGPRVLLVDCNQNGVPDLCDVDCDGGGCAPPCGSSIDCNFNSVPDECESDCNHNGIADACDIADCPPGNLFCSDCNGNLAPDICDPDCDGDGIPNDCESASDTDADGVEDCEDLCLLTTPPGSCLPPFDRVVVCCYPNGIHVEGVFTWRQCLATGGGPVCDEPPMCPGTPCRQHNCRNGCLIADSDGDGDRDLLDYALFLGCYGGSWDASGFDPPSPWCLTNYDVAGDGDVDAEDGAFFASEYTGPR